jgi:hypothetical protein
MFKKFTTRLSKYGSAASGMKFITIFEKSTHCHAIPLFVYGFLRKALVVAAAAVGNTLSKYFSTFG